MGRYLAACKTYPMMRSQLLDVLRLLPCRCIPLRPRTLLLHLSLDPTPMPFEPEQRLAPRPTERDQHRASRPYAKTHPSIRLDDPNRPLCVRLGRDILQLGLDTVLRTRRREPTGQFNDERPLGLVAAVDRAQKVGELRWSEVGLRDGTRDDGFGSDGWSAGCC